MQQLTDLWTGLSIRHRIIVVFATVAIFSAVLAMSRMASNPTMLLLYSGLDNSAAGEVVQALVQRNAAYSVNGGSIYVDAAQRDELRMTLASDGLPASSGQGYEILDGLSGFGTTSQMFDAAYWRAKEGELARTITASPGIRSARVHIANGSSNPFQRNTERTASVSVTTGGSSISADQAKALRYLVASAVAGLNPENVAVIDGNGDLIGPTDTTVSATASDDKAILLRDRVTRLLEARVGPGNAVVEVSVETVTERESIREKRFDPESRVAISLDTRESTTASNESANGGVTVASNLPDGDADKADGTSSETNESREQINYEVSETEREVLRTPGAIKRLTVAVLINGISETDASGATRIAPRTEDELASLRDLVAASVGFDDARGDLITITSMELQMSPVEGTVFTASFLDRVRFDLMSLLQLGVLALVALLLGLFVVRPILLGSPPLALPNTTTGQTPSLPALSGEISNEPAAQSPSEQDVERPASIAALSAPQIDSSPVERLRTLIGDRQEETVEILRGWLEDREENV